jgi:hypothetical protein
MPASHFDVNLMTGRPKFIVRHSTWYFQKITDGLIIIYTRIDDLTGK